MTITTTAETWFGLGLLLGMAVTLPMSGLMATTAYALWRSADHVFGRPKHWISEDAKERR